MKPNDKKKNPYERDSFWIDNKFWETEGYSDEGKRYLEDVFYKPIFDRHRNKGHLTPVN